MPASKDITLDLDLPASFAGLSDGLAAIERHCGAAGLSAAVRARTLTVFEEIFTNTVKYGYGERGNGRIHVVLTCGDPLRLVLEDSAPPFDPTAWDSSADLATGLAERPIGRHGIALVMGLSRSARWQKLSPGNRLTLELAATG